MKKIFALLILSTLFSIGCTDNTVYPYKVGEVSRIFTNSQNSYWVMIENPNKSISTIYIGNANIVCDVEKNKMSWLEIISGKDSSYPQYRLHIHSTKDINGSNTGGRVGVIE